MTRGTRSNTELPGDIHRYLLETMTGGQGGATGSDASIQSLLALMTKTLKAISDT